MAAVALGRMNRKIELWRATSTAGDAGGQDRTWTKIADYRAEGTPVGGNEGLINGTLQSNETWRLRLHFRDVRVTDRVVMDGKMYDVESVEDALGTRQFIVVLMRYMTGDPAVAEDWGS